MKRKITMLTASLFLWYGYAGAQTPCADDPNGFVASKNVSGTSSYQLKSGFEEKAAQIYKSLETFIKEFADYSGLDTASIKA
jgi:hypothetical protein